MSSKKLDRVWRSVQPSVKCEFNDKHFEPITDLVFSPSGRYGVDVNKRSTSLGNNVMLVVVLDMLTMQQKKLDSSRLDSVKEVMNFYWISETEIVVVGFDHQNHFIQVYCELQIAEGSINISHEIKIKSNSMKIHQFPGLKNMIRNIGVNPLYFNGGRYCLLNNLDYLTLVPWDVNYTIEQCYQIQLPVLEVDGYTICGPSFCLGSKIYCSVIERHFDVDVYGRTLHRIYTDRMICIDVNLLEFHERRETLNSESDAVSLVRFTKIGCNTNSTVNSIDYRQHGKFIIATEKVFLPPSGTSPKKYRYSIWVMNLKAETVYHTKLANDNNSFFVFIYDGSLLAIRDRMNQQGTGWSVEYLTILCQKKQELNLFSLCKMSMMILRIPVPSNYMKILFPDGHCCVPTLATFDPLEKKFNCYCNKPTCEKVVYNIQLSLDPSRD